MRFRKNSKQRGIERDLRDARPRQPHRAARLAVLGIAVAAVAAVGGIGFAASTAFQSAKVSVQKVSAGAAKSISVKQRVAVRNAAADQYAATFAVPPPKKGTPDLVAPPKTTPTVDASTPGVIFISTDCNVLYSGKLLLTVRSSRGGLAKLDGTSSTVDGDHIEDGDIGETLGYPVVKPRIVRVVLAVVVSNLPGTKRAKGETLTPVCTVGKDSAVAPPVTLTTAPTPVKNATPANVTGRENLDKFSVSAKVFSAFRAGKGRVVVTPAKGVTIIWNGTKSTTKITLDNAELGGKNGKAPTWDPDVTWIYPASLDLTQSQKFTVTYSAMP